MDQPKAKPEPRPTPLSQPQLATARRGGGGVARRYPKPPGFFHRILLLCLRPEFWAQSARYPTYITLLPLVAVILLGAAFATAGQTYLQASRLWDFAATYDQHYPPLELTGDGTLRVADGAALPLPLRVPTPGGVILVDPTGKTNPQTVSWDDVAALITDKDVYTRNAMESLKDEMSNADASTVVLDRQPLADWWGLRLAPAGALPEKGKVKIIRGSSLQHLLVALIPQGTVLALLWGFFQILGDAAWAAVMIFLLAPVIMQVAAFQGEGARPRRVLLLPRRAAVRMAAALTVPLVALGAVLRGLGQWQPDEGGLALRLIFWLLAAAALAVWTGIMARRMYGTAQTSRS